MEPFHMLKFDDTSTRVDFLSYKTKLMAFGALKDIFQLAYLTDLKINPSGSTSLDPNLTANVKLRSTAMSYLILTTEGVPQDLIKPAGNDPFLAWNLFTTRFQPNTIKEYARLREEMESHELEDPYNNPELLINKALRTNARLTAVKPTYGQDDEQIMTMVLGKLPKDLFEIFITNIELNGYSSMKFYELQTIISN